MSMDNLDDIIEFANRILNQRDKLSDEEVEKWLEDKYHHEVLFEMAKIRYCLQSDSYNELQACEWQRLKNKIYGKKLVWIRRYITIAALVIFAIGLGMWVWLREPTMNLEKYSYDELLPGTQRAELVLSGGKTINLGNTTAKIETNKLAGIVDDSINGLDYSNVLVLDKQVEEAYNELRVPVGGFYKLLLSDGTQVWLNAASKLRFPVLFKDAKREVFLEGEGFFQVARDTTRQFIVHLDNADITVLGTTFNVNAYKDEGMIYTTLTEGKVSFNSLKKGQQVQLTPGMQSVMNVQNGLTTLRMVDTDVYTSWVSGRFVFRSMNLEGIIRQLQRWYDFEVFYSCEAVKYYEFRGVVNRDMELRNVLDIIEETTDVKFEIKGTTVVVGKK